MQLAEIIEQDKQRGNLFKCRTAKMYRDGMFLRAYNWSMARLCAEYFLFYRIKVLFLSSE